MLFFSQSLYSNDGILKNISAISESNNFLVNEFKCYFPGSGHYIFIEASFPRRLNDTARIISTSVTTKTTKCLHFWYHMYGTHVNTLNVYLKVGSQLGNPVWTHTGTLSNKWYNANVDIMKSTNYNIVFEGVRGTSYRGDIGLDDISVTEGSCSGLYLFLSLFEDVNLKN